MGYTVQISSASLNANRQMRSLLVVLLAAWPVSSAIFSSLIMSWNSPTLWSYTTLVTITLTVPNVWLTRYTLQTAQHRSLPTQTFVKRWRSVPLMILAKLRISHFPDSRSKFCPSVHRIEKVLIDFVVLSVASKRMCSWWSVRRLWERNLLIGREGSCMISGLGRWSLFLIEYLKLENKRVFCFFFLCVESGLQVVRERTEIPDVYMGLARNRKAPPRFTKARTTQVNYVKTNSRALHLF